VSILIEAIGIHKTFRKRRSIRDLVVRPFQPAEEIQALRGVSLDVRQGEIFGLLGPNGAGKTTLLKILCCLVLPDEGRATVGGVDTEREDLVKPQIGLVHSDERSFYWRLSARENLRFFARIYDVPSARIESRIDELLARLEMSDAADRPFSGYSSGMKQRIAIARAMLHDPPILLMDEPTRSLDPAAARALRTYVRDELNQGEGKTILIATHNLHEAEEIADRVAIVAKGKVQQIGTVTEVRRWGVQERRFQLVLASAPGPLDGPFRVLSEHTENGTRIVTVALDDGADLDEMLRALLSAGVTIRACDRAEPDLEDAFARILDDGEPS
jgi:ABC-2 type transport system ATP-binding protein